MSVRLDRRASRVRSYDTTREASGKKVVKAEIYESQSHPELVMTDIFIKIKKEKEQCLKPFFLTDYIIRETIDWFLSNVRVPLVKIGLD